MRNKRILSLLLTVILLITAAMPCAFAENGTQDVNAAGMDKPTVRSARSVLVGDLDSGRILYAENAYTRCEPASITKVMTMLLAVEAIERGDVALNDMVTASDNCHQGMNDESSTSNIYSGETMSLNDLLYCAALASANEACNIIAEHVAGSIELFVTKMNERAQELGCSGTHFVNTHGMPDTEHYTTARDLFVLACEAMKHEQFAKLVGTATYTTAATNAAGERTLQNSNALLTNQSMYGSQYVYEGAKGIKTGHTSAAGYCLLSAAERNGVKLIGVVLGADAQLGETNNFDNFADTVSLLDWAFNNFAYRTLVSPEDVVGSQPVIKGRRTGKIDLKPAESISAVVSKSASVAQFKKEIMLYDDSISSADEGTELGELALYDTDGTVLGKVKLLAAGDVVYKEKTPKTHSDNEGLSAMQKTAIILVCAVLLVILLIVVTAIVRRRRYIRARRRRIEAQKRKRP